MSNLFISHVYGLNDYKNLVNLLDKTPNFEYRNYSVPEDDPIPVKSDKELYQELEQQIRPASCVLIPAGVYAT